MKPRKICITTDRQDDDNLIIGGWYDGPRTYLRFENSSGEFLGTISGRKLKRLAERITKRMAKP
jgi:hypothetical protein